MSTAVAKGPARTHEPAQEAVGGHLGDPAAAGRARLQVFVDRFGRGKQDAAAE